MEKMKVNDIRGMFEIVANEMVINKDHLIQLDAQNGDGDLGLSMTGGFTATVDMLSTVEESDLGKVFLKISKTFNEAAPSTMGTLLSIVFMGIAKSLKGYTEIDAPLWAQGFEAGLQLLMDKGGAKPGEKTIIDSLYPAVQVMNDAAAHGTFAEMMEKAAEAARQGMEATKDMRSVHGRAAYYGDKSIGIQDGGATVGMLLMKGCAAYWMTKKQNG